MDGRIPAHLEVAGLIRAVQAEGGFATVLAKGERDAGTLLVVCCERGQNPSAYERMPKSDGTRAWTVTARADNDDPEKFSEYLARRRRQDDDLWILELDVPNPERFVDS